MAIKILIADAHALLRQGIKRVLNFEEDLEVVGEAEDGGHGRSGEGPALPGPHPPKAEGPLETFCQPVAPTPQARTIQHRGETPCASLSWEAPISRFRR